MAATDEFLRLLVEIKGDQAIPDLEKKLANLGRETANLRALNQQAAISEELLASEMQRVADQSVHTTAMINQLRGGRGVSGQGVMGLSFAMQDFLSANGDFVQGLYRIQNNIPVLLSQLGAGAGLAGVISMVSLGIGVLLPYIQKMIEGFRDAGSTIGWISDATENLSKKIDDLSKKKWITADESRNLENLKARLMEIKGAAQAVEEMRSKQTAEEKVKAGGFAAGLESTGTPAREIVKTLVATERDKQIRDSKVIATLEKQLEAAQRNVKAMGDLTGEGAIYGQVSAIQERDRLRQELATEKEKIARRGGEAEQEVGKLLDAATKGFGAAQEKARDDFVIRLHQAGMGGAAANILGATGVMGPPTPGREELFVKRREHEQAIEKEAREKEQAEKKAEREQEKRDREAEAAEKKSDREFERKMEEQERADAEKARRLLSRGDTELKVERMLAAGGQTPESVAEKLDRTMKVEPGVSWEMVKQARERLAARTEEAGGNVPQVARDLDAEIKARRRGLAKRKAESGEEEETRQLAAAIQQGKFGEEGTQFSPEMAQEAAAKAIKTMNILGINQAGTRANQATLEAMGEVANAVMALMMRSKAQEGYARMMEQQFRAMNGHQQHAGRIGH